jgi:hypothetical protein
LDFKKEKTMAVESVSDAIFDNVKRFVVASEDIDDFGKQAVLYLMDGTRNLSRACCLKADHVKLGQSMAFGVHDMGSLNGRTHLDSFLDAMGIEGSFHSRTDSGPRWVIWFAPDVEYRKDGREIEWNPERIEELVDLSLYLPNEEVIVEGSFLTPSSLAALQGANFIALATVNNLTFGLDAPAKIGFRLYQYQPIGKGDRRYPMLVETIHGAKLFVDICIRNIQGIWTPVSADLVFKPFQFASNRLDGTVQTRFKLNLGTELRTISCRIKAKGLPDPMGRKSV